MQWPRRSLWWLEESKDVIQWLTSCTRLIINLALNDVDAMASTIANVSPRSRDLERPKVHNTADPKQKTFTISKAEIPYWRRVLITRYYNFLGQFSDVNVNWSDYDKTNNIIEIDDEARPFSTCLLPELFKSRTRIHHSNNKLLTITLYYTTQTCLIQGHTAENGSSMN